MLTGLTSNLVNPQVQRLVNYFNSVTFSLADMLIVKFIHDEPSRNYVITVGAFLPVNFCSCEILRAIPISGLRYS